MSVLSRILDKVYADLSQWETIDRNSIINSLPKKEYLEVWKIEAEIKVNNSLREVCLFIAFDKFFPLSIPCIYLSQESYDTIKYIPHIDEDRYVCTFHKDAVILDKNNPLKIVCDCLRRAKDIIQQGLEGTNHIDFRDEIRAYWRDSVSDMNLIQYLSLITEYPKETKTFRVYKINQPYNGFKYFLYEEENSISKLFLEFLAEKDCKGSSFDALFLADYKINSKPPFDLTNESVLNSISQSSLKIFKEYINGKTVEKHIFFLAETTSTPILLGWKHKPLNTKINGFRPGTFSSFDILSKRQKNNLVEKFLVSEYSNHRIEKRTSGVIRKKYDFLVAGLGSIGSNLIYFLNGINYPNYKFIDDDFLQLENIGRHLLGLNNVHSNKTNALKAYIKNIRPDQNVVIKTARLESVLYENLDFFNDCSYAFIAIGNQNIENLLVELHNEGKITVPMFFLWVEPYALGGHCLFIHPNDKVYVNELYENHLYRFNVIAPDEYKASNPVLTKQEAGCETSYTPYSGNDVILFLSSIYKWINDIIQKDIKHSIAVRWIGNLDTIKELKIQTADNILNRESFSNEVIILHNDN